MAGMRKPRKPARDLHQKCDCKRIELPEDEYQRYCGIMQEATQLLAEAQKIIEEAERTL
jgi:hypothetical protein